MNREYINFSKITVANIYLRDSFVGTLEKRDNGSYLFEYSDDWVKVQSVAIATSFPLSQRKYESTVLHPFFDNLIAEGWLLGYAEKVFQIDKSNRFAMLVATGESTIGAVKIKPVYDGREISLHSYYAKDITSDDLKKYILQDDGKRICPYCLGDLSEKDKKHFHLKCATEMWGTTREISIFLESEKPLNSFQRTVYGGSVSGAQRKGLFTFNKGKLIPNPYKSHYILKPQGDYDELPENEHVTMVIAKRIGFRVPPIMLMNVEKVGRIFAIKRFDFSGEHSLKKEDMAQILKLSSQDKYESSCEQVAKAIRRYSSAPAIDMIDFWRRLLFCYITANADMHLKNWSLLENSKMNDNWELAPCYDLLNTRIPIPREQLDIGLTINGKKRNLQRSYFQKFAQDHQINDSVIKKTFEELQDWLKVIEETLPKSCLSLDAQKKYLDFAQARFHELQV